MRATYTAWHYFLAEVMQHLFDDRYLEVHPFEKLGTLPLEADIILLRQHSDVDLAALHPEFDFLLRHLGSYTVVEYKSPYDRLTPEDLDTVRAYAMLCKRKFGLARDQEVRIALLYSRTEKGFFRKCRENGLTFRSMEPGIRCCQLGDLVLLAMDLVRLGERRPAGLINLFSLRHRDFVISQAVTPKLLDVVKYVYENIFKRDAMKHSEVRNLPEFTQDMYEIRRRLLKGYTTEERLAGLAPEDIVRHLTPEEIVHHLAQAELEQLRKLLEKP